VEGAVGPADKEQASWGRRLLKKASLDMDQAGNKIHKIVYFLV